MKMSSKNLLEFGVSLLIGYLLKFRAGTWVQQNTSATSTTVVRSIYVPTKLSTNMLKFDHL